MALTCDGYGRLKTKTIGHMKHTYVYDNASGNLLPRDYRLSGSSSGLTESFQYDNLNRLTGSQVSGAGLMSVTYSPDGNIITKSDAGSYTYDPSKPNAVSSISGNNGTISQEDQLITYNGYNLTTRIEEGNSAYSVYYNPLKQRIKTVCTSVGAPAITRYYSGSYEKTITGSTVTETHYVTSPAGLIAILVKQGSNVQIYYVETDHLGSVTGIINTNKSYVFKASYDAWGRRRNPTDWSYNNIPATLITDRGFTGHEHLDGFGLINMNGRMYDPVAGRFLGVDPVILAPDYSQSFNAYSYCWNNPLKYTDPSGFPASWDEFWFIANKLWNSSNGGSWHSSSDDVVYYPDGYQGGGYCITTTIIEGHEQDGPQLLVMLPEVTVIDFAKKKNTRDPAGRGDYDDIPLNPAIGMGERIVGIANSYVGSTDYNLLSIKDDFLRGNPKCNKFVYDVLLRAGASPGLPNQPGRWGLPGPKPPIASQWANTNYSIPGWVVVNSPFPGDVASFNGHIGIVIGNGLTISATLYDGVVRNDWGFRSEQTPVFRRFVGYSPYY